MSTLEFNSSLGMPASYYTATAGDVPTFPPAQGAIDADLCVIGGGCTGLSAALHAAKEGLSVVLIEGGRIGWGASGRNGGQIIPGLRKSASELVRLYGNRQARSLFELTLRAQRLVLELISEHAIDCDLKLTGHLTVASKPSEIASMQQEVRVLHEAMEYPHVRYLDEGRTRDEVAATYYGGVLDELGGHFHPLNYALGLARAVRGAGVSVFEHSPAIAVEAGSRVLVRVPQGQVCARSCILAGDALLPELGTGISAYIMPVANYLGATEPLPDPCAIIGYDRAVSDSRFVVNYFRLTADGRLLFGGGERYSAEAPRDIHKFVHRHMRRVFPQLASRRIEYAWGGLVSVTRTRLPHIGRDRNILYAHGYSGLGVILSTLAGKLLAEELAGRSDGFELLASVAPRRFPGGQRLRPLLHLLGMLWYASLDRIPW